MYQNIKKKVYTLLHPELGKTIWDRVVIVIIITLIILNVIAVMLETVQPIYEDYQSFFHVFDTFSIVVFSVEYLLRVWSCNIDPRYSHSIWGRLRYVFTLGALIDLLAILPFYIHIIVGLDLRVLRVLRLLRLLRVFHLTAYMKAAQLIVNIFKAKRNELLLSLVLIFFLLIISSCLIYFVEHPAQPEHFSSIPRTLWWSIVTLTTVGYGDMIPITIQGKILTGFILLSGVALFALPAGIITAGFLEESRKAKNKSHHACPHCGMPIDFEIQHHH